MSGRAFVILLWTAKYACSNLRKTDLSKHLDPMQSTSSSFCAHTTTKWQYCHAEHDSLCVHPQRRCLQAFAHLSFSPVKVFAYCCIPWRMKCIVCTAIFDARASALLSSVPLSVRLDTCSNSSGLASDYHHSCTCFSFDSLSA